MNININTGDIRLTVNDDESRVIKFNPNDLAFIERFYGFVIEFEDIENEYNDKKKKLKEVTEVDDMGLPVNMQDHINLMKDTGEMLKGKIDDVFGEGTSKAAFDDANTFDMFEQFIDGITPYIQKSREGKIKKYTSPAGVNKRNVMK